MFKSSKNTSLFYFSTSICFHRSLTHCNMCPFLHCRVSLSHAFSFALSYPTSLNFALFILLSLSCIVRLYFRRIRFFSSFYSPFFSSLYFNVSLYICSLDFPIYHIFDSKSVRNSVSPCFYYLVSLCLCFISSNLSSFEQYSIY